MVLKATSLENGVIRSCKSESWSRYEGGIRSYKKEFCKHAYVEYQHNLNATAGKELKQSVLLLNSFNFCAGGGIRVVTTDKSHIAKHMILLVNLVKENVNLQDEMR